MVIEKMQGKLNHTQQLNQQVGVYLDDMKKNVALASVKRVMQRVQLQDSRRAVKSWKITFRAQAQPPI